MRAVTLLSLLLAAPVWAGPALAIPDPVSNPFAPILPSGITARLIPLATVPPEADTPPTARITYVTSPLDGTNRLFVTDLNGILYQTGSAGSATAGATPTPYLNLATQNIGLAVTSDVTGPGLASVAFHPNFDGDPALPGFGKFYTTETVPNTGTTASLGSGVGPNLVEVREWTTADPKASTFQGTSRVVMTLSGYADTHSDGLIAFNPTAGIGTADYGKLYIGSGDGHYNDADQNAQNLGVPQGKMLRIDPLQGPQGQAYTIPSDNPFVGQSGKLGEIWAYGLRYPQSFGWDPVTGTMYINDLGQASIEEVDVGAAGANYGWSQRAGTFATGYAYGLSSDDEHIYPLPPGAASQGYTDPIAEYSHSEGYAVGSGVLYRGTAIPALYGMYVMADVVTGRLLVFDPAAAPPGGQALVSELQLTQDGQIIDTRAMYGYESYLNGPRIDERLSLDPSGEILVTMKANGTVFQLAASTDVPEPGSAALLLAALGVAWRRRLAS